ncbi:hypothetical protein C4J65_10490 [Streptomyces sp. CB09001]|uniref:hypothetical protein n=1 Tax=Streptomyces sp. CB09001 TaxID=2083284 RepID=UPI000E213FFE|nr:hypothetical protein [Streptomyces sp. CB09001]AXL88707.1 hypothetical protein C4J65_10490 [Streptomyces sp. CB09001]
MSTQPKMTLDFSKIRGGRFNPIHKPEGEYLGVVTSFEETKTRSGTAMWVFGVTLRQDSSAIYPVYCILNTESVWKLRRLLMAVGFTVPKKRITVDGNKLIGKDIAVCLEDDEYEDGEKSVIGSVFPASEYEGSPRDADKVCTTPPDSDFQAVFLELFRRLVGQGPHGPEGIEALTMALSRHGLDPDNAVGPAINNLASSVYEAGDKIRGGLDSIAQAIRGAVRCTDCYEWFIPADLVQVDEIGYRPNKPTCKPCAVKVTKPTGAAQEWARRIRIERQASHTHQPEELAESLGIELPDEEN